MNKEFIPYSEALALKELGFNIPSRDYYRITGSGVFSETKEYNWNDDEKHETAGKMTYVTAALYQQAFRWFREEHNIYGSYEESNKKWTFVILDTLLPIYHYPIVDVDSGKDNDQEFSTYEEAELECLRKLIQIVKEKK